jgi:hypothetical protein
MQPCFRSSVVASKSIPLGSSNDEIPRTCRGPQRIMGLLSDGERFDECACSRPEGGEWLQIGHGGHPVA